MNFKLTSTKLLSTLAGVATRFSGQRIGATLSVSPEAAWWYYHEFGTATHEGDGSFELPPGTVVQEPEGTANSGGYPILPKDGEAIRLPGTSGFPEPLIVPQVGAEFTHEHPGVPALGLVRSVMEEIHQASIVGIANALHEGEYYPTPVQEAITTTVMPEVLDIIVGSIENLMGKTEDRDTPGKLGGASPASVFKGAATIEPLE